tara:strand:- start:47 stop:244 length:198 start_codon:yes stop_codon:yes gene_type:complete
MKRFIDKDAVEFRKLLKECDRLDLINVCWCWYQDEVENDELSVRQTKEEIVEKIIQEFPEKIIPK